MSKSKGNVVDPVILCSRYGVDAVRYFLLREVPFGQDGNFTNEALIHRINADLANDLGNLVSRTVAMAHKYFGGSLPSGRACGDEDKTLIDMAQQLAAKVEKSMDALQIPTALADIFQLISRANKYIDETQPWILGKDEASHPRLACVLYNLLESIRVATVLLSPFMPGACPKIFEQIGAGEDMRSWDSAGKFGLLSATVTVGKGQTLFPRIDLEKELAELESLSAPAQPVPAEKPAPKTEGVVEMVEIGDFAKIALRVAKVTECERVPKSDKLLRIQLDDGQGSRQIVSGIAHCYEPEQLVGKKLILVANLKPAKLRGVESNGMLLAANMGDGARVIFVDDDLPCGAIVR